MKPVSDWTPAARRRDAEEAALRAAVRRALTGADPDPYYIPPEPAGDDGEDW